MTNIENPLAYSFFLQDDIFLLDADKQAIKAAPAAVTTAVADAVPAAVAEPIAVTAAVAELKMPETTFNYLGSNKARYLIIAHYPADDFMAEAHLTALSATLKRLGVEAHDTAIFNLAKHADAEFKQITGYFKPQRMLILGHEALPRGLRVLPQHKPLQGAEIRTLFTFSFAEMMNSAENKKAFWEAMKSL